MSVPTPRSGVLSRLDGVEPRRLARWLRVLVVLVLLGLISHGHYAGSGDAVHYMVIASSLALDRDLDLANNYDGPGSLLMADRLDHGAHARPGRNGVLRPVHDVGLPLLAAPYFGLAHAVAERLTPSLPAGLRRKAKLDPWIALRQLLSIGMILVTAALATVFFGEARSLTGRAGTAFAGALLFVVSPPILSHGYVFFSEIPSALLTLMVYAALRKGSDLSRLRAGSLGAMTGFLLLLHVRNAGLALGLLAVALCRLWGTRARAAAFGLGFLALAGARIALNVYLWDDPLFSPHARPGSWSGWMDTLTTVATRGLGLALDQRHGLLPYAPVYLLAPAGWLLLRRQEPRVARELVVLVSAAMIPILLPTLNYHGWRGGWSPAARFLVPVAALAALPAVVAASRLATPVVLGLVIWQGLLDAFFWSRPMLLWNEGPGPAAFLLEIGGEALASLFPSWDPVTGRALIVCLGVVAAWLGLTAWLVRRAAPAESLRRGHAQW